MAAWDECWQNRRRLAAPEVGSALTLNRYQLFQLFKYGVYTLIAFNVYLFFVEEFAAARLQFPEGVPPSHWIEAYAATIDTAAWLILLLLFEAETNWLADDHFTRRVVWSLHGLRLFSYTFIVYAFYGYIVNLQFVSIWLKSQSLRLPSQATQIWCRHISPSTVCGLNESSSNSQ
jgi:hypothetical protein